MSDELDYRRVMRQSNKLLIDDIDSQSMLDQFTEHNFSSTRTIRDIQELRNTSEMNRKIIESVLTKGVSGYRNFKKFLRDTKQGHIADSLEKTEKEDKEDQKSKPSHTPAVYDMSKMYENMSDNRMTVFDGPTWFIKADGAEFTLNVETLQQLSTIKKPLNVVSIVGEFRTGKSYLISRLAGKDKGFPVSHDTGALTTGIWAWCVQHPELKDQQLLLLDTEGFGNVKKANKIYDNKIFTLAALLSSTLIYNIRGAFGDEAVTKLGAGQKIKTSEHKADEEGGRLDVYLPELLLVLRDFCLDFKVNGKEATANEYLEDCLNTISPKAEGAHEFNEPRILLRKYFKRRNCFPLVSPTGSNKLKRLATLPREEFDEGFFEDLSKFKGHIFEKTEPFQTVNGEGINGRMFATLAEKYVDAISKGAIPCIDMTMQAMAEKENLYIVNMAVDVYNTVMRSLNLPTTNESELIEVHQTAKAVAHQIYLDKRVMDTEYKAKQNLDTMVYGMFTKTKERNQELSKERCLKKIEELHKPIAEGFSLGTYFVNGGFSKYKDDINQMIQTFNACERIGFMKEQVKFSYLQNIEKEKTTILQQDNMIKKTAKAKQMAEDAQKQVEIVKRMANLAEEEAKKENKIFQRGKEVEFKLLQQRAEEDRRRLQERMDEIIGRKQGEIERLNEESQDRERQFEQRDMERLKAFEKEKNLLMDGIIRELEAEIERLKKEGQESKTRFEWENNLGFFGRLNLLFMGYPASKK